MTPELDSGAESSDAEFREMMLSLHSVYPDIIDANGDFIYHPVISDPEQRAAHTEELEVASLKDRAATYLDPLSLIPKTPAAMVLLIIETPKTKLSVQMNRAVIYLTGL